MFCESLRKCSTYANASDIYSFHRYRSKEYDTYRNPSEPLSASAQLFFGAIGNIVTGLVTAPAGIVSNVITVRHILTRPHAHSDPQTQCGCTDHGTDQEVPDSTEGHGDIDTTTTRDLSQHLNDNARKLNARPESVLHPEAPTMIRSDFPTVGFHGVMSELTVHGVRGLQKLARMALWLPTNITITLAKGFCNAPKLYNDYAIPSNPRLTGFRSGLKAAGTVSALFIQLDPFPFSFACVFSSTCSSESRKNGIAWIHS